MRPLVLIRRLRADLYFRRKFGKRICRNCVAFYKGRCIMMGSPLFYDDVRGEMTCDKCSTFHELALLRFDINNI